MKKLVIIGTGSFAGLMCYYAQEYGHRQVAAFSVDSAYLDQNACSIGGGVDVVPLETLERTFPPEDYEVLLGVGYSKMNQVRAGLFSRCKEKGYTVASFVHPTAVVAKGVELGEGTVLLEGSILQPFVRLGKGNLIWHGVRVAHDTTLGDFNTLCQGTSIAGICQVGSSCFFGNGCVTLGALKVADYTLVGAGAVLKGDTRPYQVIVPARSVILEDRKSTNYV